MKQQNAKSNTRADLGDFPNAAVNCADHAVVFLIAIVRTWRADEYLSIHAPWK